MNAVVNLNKARKARARLEAKAHAAQNRVRFGRTKAQKALADADAETLVRHIDAHERERP